MERHLGHRSYADNLRAMVDRRDDVDVQWVPIDYAPTSRWWERLPAESLRGTLRGRRETTHGLAHTTADVCVFNTQVPAVIGGRAVRARPFVLCSDVTPAQYDEMASGYQHRADRPGPVRWLKHGWNQRVFRRAAAHAPWSHWVRRSLIDDYGVDPSRIEVVPPGVDTTEWRPGRSLGGPMRILFVGGDFHRKGGDLLLEALATFPEGAVELHAVTRSSVERRPGLHVHHGLEPGSPELRELFATSDVFALPSNAETFGIAAVEGAAAAMPVVLSAVGGLADLVTDEVTGFSVPPGDVTGLTRALHRLADDPDLRRRLGRAARQRVETEFDAETNADRLVRLAVAAAGPT